jgi:hypothetical protein
LASLYQFLFDELGVSGSTTSTAAKRPSEKVKVKGTNAEKEEET